MTKKGGLAEGDPIEGEDGEVTVYGHNFDASPKMMVRRPKP